jgi:hypothetical protein
VAAIAPCASRDFELAAVTAARSKSQYIHGTLARRLFAGWKAIREVQLHFYFSSGPDKNGNRLWNSH